MALSFTRSFLFVSKTDLFNSMLSRFILIARSGKGIILLSKSVHFFATDVLADHSCLKDHGLNIYHIDLGPLI